MSDRAELLREAEHAFGELREAIGGLAEEEMCRVWLGTWGVREILIHVSGWHRAMTPALAHIARGEPPYPAGTYDDFNAWNARFVDRETGAKIAHVLAELDASHRDFVAAAAAVPEPHFAAGGAARDLFEGTGPSHYREHTAQIREWRRAVAR